jgi:hypothetical protein
MNIKEAQELVNFRVQSYPHVDPESLRKLENNMFRQSSDLGRDVAEVYFQEKCLESFNLMCKELAVAGYKKLVVTPNSTLRASPAKRHDDGGAPLFTIAKKYFPCHTSRGGDASSDVQDLVVTSFPRKLVKEHCLCKKCLL